MTDATLILRAIDAGDAVASRELLPLIYEELKQIAAGRLAHEQANVTLQATALVHEAYIRLVGKTDPKWQSRAHFFGAAAEAMRRILVDHARRRKGPKRGGGSERVELDVDLLPAGSAPTDLLALDEALVELASEAPAQARLVELRYFGGLNLKEASAALGISRATGVRYWSYARAWLYERIQGEARVVGEATTREVSQGHRK